VPSGIALALCEGSSDKGGADKVFCKGTSDGVDTSWGDDQITVEAGTQVGGATGVDAGRGNDIVYNYGEILPIYDGINMRAGNAEVYNYGRISAPDDGIWCVIEANQSCMVTNYGTVAATNETVDLRNQGGAFRLYNEGWMRSYEQEAIHMYGGLSNQITNYGTIYGWKSGVETNGGYLHLDNFGIIVSEHEMGINSGSEDDIIVNTGTIRSNYHVAIGTSSGADTVTNTGIIRARNHLTYNAPIELGPGNDTLITSGHILELWMGANAIKAGFGNDTVIVQGGIINKMINGGTEADGREEHDVLVFEFSGTQDEIDAFEKQIAAQTAMDGSATWRGLTYTWTMFEEIRLALTVANQ
jgi:hypothetical protein